MQDKRCCQLQLFHEKRRYVYICIRPAIWSGRALSFGTKVTTNDNFHAGFNTLSFRQLVVYLFAAREGQTPKGQTIQRLKMYTYSTLKKLSVTRCN